MLEKVVGPILVVIVIFILLHFLEKKGVLSYKFPPIKLFFLSNHTFKKAHVSYRLYNGINKYQLKVKPDETVTFKYNVSVARGSLILKASQNNNVFFEKKFKANTDDEDTITFNSNGRFFTVTIIGSYTKGGCDVDIVKDQ